MIPADQVENFDYLSLSVLKINLSYFSFSDFVLIASKLSNFCKTSDKEGLIVSFREVLDHFKRKLNLYHIARKSASETFFESLIFDNLSKTLNI